jgi:hypothetical protein
MSRVTDTLRRRARTRDERGVTITEIITVIVILGLVMVPLAFTLNQAITLVPQSTDRTQQAIDRTFFVSKFADDVANSNQQPVLVANKTTCVAPTVPLELGQYISMVNTADTTDTTDDRFAQYYVWQAPVTPTLTKVVVQRVYGKYPLAWGFATAISSTTVATGYCVPGQPLVESDIESGGTSFHRLRLRLSMMDTPTEPVRVVNLEGAMHVTL